MRPGYLVRYVSASGEVLELSRGGIDLTPTELVAWELDTVAINSHIAGLVRSLPEIEVPAIIVAPTSEEGIAARNRLYEIPARDRAALTPGRLYINDWYITGYIKSATPNNFWQTGRAAQYEVTFVATDPNWTRETSFEVKEEQGQEDEWLNFPYDFPYNFGGTRQTATVSNDNYSDSPILLRVYGTAINPAVTIAGNTYQANVSLAEGDRLEIDGISSTATVIRSNGAHENAFGFLVGELKRGSGSYPFQPIPPGESEIQWGGGFNIDIVVFEQREEPRWR